MEEECLMSSLPPEHPVDLSPQIEEALQSNPDEMILFLEDDSTGVQKSHDVYLVTDYSKSGLSSGVRAAREAKHRLLFVLTNSRALSSRQAEALNRQIAQRLRGIAHAEGMTFRVGSRSDSTLRGYFPLEPLVLMKTLESGRDQFDGIIVSHAFLTEMGRITVNRKHLLRVKKEDGSFWYRPVHLTRFAEDERFGYPTSDMAEYAEFKFATSRLGTVKAGDVLHIDIDALRKGGPDQVRKTLLKAKNKQVITLDVVNRRDLQVFVLGLLQAEREGKKFVYRSAASFPPARVNMTDKSVLDREDILGSRAMAGNILCLWGSIVELSNVQLEIALARIPDIEPIPFDVKRVLTAEKDRVDEIQWTVKKTEDAFSAGKHAIVYTVPRTEYPSEKLSDEIRVINRQTIAAGLQEVFSQISIQPAVTIFKGGATSSTGLFGSGAKRVYVLGQIAPGIPIVRISPQDNERFPGKEMLMVLGPGNVGGPTTYVEIFNKLAQ